MWLYDDTYWRFSSSAVNIITLYYGLSGHLYSLNNAVTHSNDPPPPLHLSLWPSSFLLLLLFTLSLPPLLYCLTPHLPPLPSSSFLLILIVSPSCLSCKIFRFLFIVFVIPLFSLPAPSSLRGGDNTCLHSAVHSGLSCSSPLIAGTTSYSCTTSSTLTQMVALRAIVYPIRVE